MYWEFFQVLWCVTFKRCSIIVSWYCSLISLCDTRLFYVLVAIDDKNCKWSIPNEVMFFFCLFSVSRKLVWCIAAASWWLLPQTMAYGWLHVSFLVIMMALSNSKADTLHKLAVIKCTVMFFTFIAKFVLLYFIFFQPSQGFLIKPPILVWFCVSSPALYSSSAEFLPANCTNYLPTSRGTCWIHTFWLKPCYWVEAASCQKTITDLLDVSFISSLMPTAKWNPKECSQKLQVTK